MPGLDEYVPAYTLVDWAAANLNIVKPRHDMTDEDIRQIMRWIGECAYDTVYVDGDRPLMRRVGIGMMLSVTLLEFPEFYTRHELAQWN